MTDSRGSSTRGSPYGSSTDLMDDEQEMYVERTTKKTRSSKNVGGVNLADEEANLRKIQQEAGDSVSGLNNIRNQSQVHSRRIHDLQVQFDEARLRIDKLLSRKSRSRSDFADYDRKSSTSVSAARPVRASVDSVSSSDSTTRVEITMEPRVQNPTFSPVSLVVNVNEEED